MLSVRFNTAPRALACVAHAVDSWSLTSFTGSTCSTLTDKGKKRGLLHLRLSHPHNGAPEERAEQELWCLGTPAALRSAGLSNPRRKDPLPPTDSQGLLEFSSPPLPPSKRTKSNCRGRGRQSGGDGLATLLNTFFFLLWVKGTISFSALPRDQTESLFRPEKFLSTHAIWQMNQGEMLTLLSPCEFTACYTTDGRFPRDRL